MIIEVRGGASAGQDMVRLEDDHDRTPFTGPRRSPVADLIRLMGPLANGVGRAMQVDARPRFGSLTRWTGRAPRAALGALRAMIERCPRTPISLANPTTSRIAGPALRQRVQGPATSTPLPPLVSR